MKQAYISLILPIFNKENFPSESDLLKIDSELSLICRSHEIIVGSHVNEHLDLNFKSKFTGPVTIVVANVVAKRDEVVLACMARAAGDFVIEWHGAIDSLTLPILNSLIKPTNQNIELIELISETESKLLKLFYKLVNILRPRNAPIRRVIGRTYSRRVLSFVLSATSFEPQLEILFSESSAPRAHLFTPLKSIHKSGMLMNIREGVSLLTKGSKFGSAVPLLLSALSASFGLAAAIYALVIFFLKGTPPQGWTTLMVVLGFGQASMLALLGLLWSRIDYLTRGLSRKSETTLEVLVKPPLK